MVQAQLTTITTGIVAVLLSFACSTDRGAFGGGGNANGGTVNAGSEGGGASGGEGVGGSGGEGVGGSGAGQAGGNAGSGGGAPAENGAICAAGSNCQSGHCVDGVCCDAECDAVCQACVQVKTGATDGVCEHVAVATDPDAECPDGQCNGAGACLNNDGQGCGDGSECLSGHCADAVCCNVACDGLCEACVASKSGGVDGTCAFIPNNADPDNECSLPVNNCNGNGACQF